MSYEIKQDGKFKYIEEGTGEPLVLLHGLFGALSNFEPLIEYFRRQYKVVVPMLHLLELDLLHTSVSGIEKFVQRFIEHRKLQQTFTCWEIHWEGMWLYCTSLNIPKTLNPLYLQVVPGFLKMAWVIPIPNAGIMSILRRRPS